MSYSSKMKNLKTEKNSIDKNILVFMSNSKTQT